MAKYTLQLTSDQTVQVTDLQMLRNGWVRKSEANRRIKALETQVRELETDLTQQTIRMYELEQKTKTRPGVIDYA